MHVDTIEPASVVMDALRAEVMAEHFRLIAQLEDVYAAQFGKLMEQKKTVHLALQQTLYAKLLEVNQIAEACQAAQLNLDLPPVIQNMAHSAEPKQESDHEPLVGVRAKSECPTQAMSVCTDELIKNLELTLFNCNPTPSSSLRCAVCPTQRFESKADLDFHATMHSLQRALNGSAETDALSNLGEPDLTQLGLSLPMALAIKPELNREAMPFAGFASPRTPPLRPNEARSGNGESAKPFGCPSCARSFRQRRELERHFINRHTANQDKPFKCRFCEYGAATKSIVQRHEYTHSAVKPYKCQLCAYQTAYRYILKKHLHKLHGVGLDDDLDQQGDDDDVVKCETEKAKQRTPVSKAKKKWKCGFCAKCFTAKSLMAQHQLVHGGPKDFKCDLCPFETAQLSTRSFSFPDVAQL